MQRQKIGLWKDSKKGKEKGKMPKETNEEVQKGVLKHEMGKASQTEKSSEFTLPIL